MTRLIVRLAVIILIPIFIGMLPARIQLARNDVTHLLIHDGCDVPCFIGIQPGITPVGEAVKLLESNAWVHNIEARYTDFGQSTNTFWGYVYWEWRPGTPLWTNAPSYTLGLHPSYLRILDGHVNEIAFSTSVPLGTAVLGLGTGGLYVLERPDRYGARPYPVTQHFYYPDVGLVLGSISMCPETQPDWHQATVVKLWTQDYFKSFMQVNEAIGPSLAQARLTARVGCR